MDPLMAWWARLLVIRWSTGLLNGTSKVLLDHQIPVGVQKRIIEILESYKDTRVSGHSYLVHWSGDLLPGN